ncbi:MAG: TerB family tellurite resistance protein [Mesorhizobium sp.]
MLDTVLAKVRMMIEGDPGIRKVADDPVLSAELLLLFRMILADGKVDDSEMVAFRRICRESFGIEEDSVDGVVDYLNDFGYETTGIQAVELFRDLSAERRVALARHMAEIARADTELSVQEVRLLKRTLELLGLDPGEPALL